MLVPEVVRQAVKEAIEMAMPEAIAALGDGREVAFDVHVAEKTTPPGRVLFVGVSFPGLDRRAQVRAAFWGACCRLDVLHRTATLWEAKHEVPALLPSAEHVAALSYSGAERIAGVERVQASDGPRVVDYLPLLDTKRRSVEDQKSIQEISERLKEMSTGMTFVWPRRGAQ